MNQLKNSYPDYRLPDPSRHFLASENTIYDYSHLFGFCSKFKKMKEDYSLSEKRPLALLSKSSDQLIFVIAACYLLKIPFTSLNPELTDSELESQTDQLKPAAFFADEENRERLPDQNFIDVHQNDLDLIASRKSIDPPSSDPEKIFGYFYTSGSSGQVKIVPLLRRQIIVAAAASEVNFKPDPDRYWLLCMPLNHIGGISIILRSLLYNTSIFRMDHFDEHQVRTFLSENRLFQVASLVPTMLQRLLDDSLFQLHLDFKAMLLGGGPISTGLVERSLTRGIPIVTSYGMTETCAQIAANPMLQPRGMYYPKRSVGPVFEPNQIQIRDPEAGIVQPLNEVGEIWLKGPQVIDKYLDPSLNTKAFDSNGWFNTGDIGHLNRQKHLFIKNRRTDRIITGGENVDPVEVESILNKLSNIQKSAVFGISDMEWGQKVVALLEVSDPKAFEPETLTKLLKKELSGFKIPKEYVIVGQIPTTSLGKIRRGELYVLYQKHLG